MAVKPIPELEPTAASPAEAASSLLEPTTPLETTTPHIERPAEFRHALLMVIGYVGTPHDPAPPTETIILKSAD